ncbi:hypothetical protein C8R44DRAFT_727312 [Mycena epipterygia]|nr:hypothetical protein C8R44DRAFT_727312 [Mycena epipterygia]
MLQGHPTGAREENVLSQRSYTRSKWQDGKFGKEEEYISNAVGTLVLIPVNFAWNFGLADFAQNLDPQHCAFAGSAEFPQWQKYEFGVSCARGNKCALDTHNTGAAFWKVLVKRREAKNQINLEKCATTTTTLERHFGKF